MQYETRGIDVGTGGELKVTLAEDGSTVTYKSLAAGIIHAIAASRVWATGTTANEILALY